MAGLGAKRAFTPAIHVVSRGYTEDADAGDKRGHHGVNNSA